ncbi:hypothetical protein SAMD00019534_116010 [Acytostelium subglobosum LB1]|uniref:hypothetical protein n=1 Tax=Acytostelium subglobosum LB1 TaxID=1410327 RepID=UPI000644B901|nr:hypothetical protein SAMD00019534_116010 [Acytostelium subglobosum LB1]GAM28425.1 hypothetical protein SAMD00019534_116010 [Acytostelium subglobosum LB1]|eukprot:XP_012748742.1 hypothetical protein SAMD00019534_116010 [Acytostelium subglobosum LB1]
MKDEDDILKRVHKYMKGRKKKKSSTQSPTVESNTVFPDEFKCGKDHGYYIFNDCFVMVSKQAKPTKAGLSSLLQSSSSSKLVWTINDCSLLKSTKVIDIADIFGFMNSLLLVTEKSCYYVQLLNQENKERMLNTVAMSRVDWKKTLDSSLADSNDGSLSDSTNSASALASASITSVLPGLLTLRPPPPPPNSSSSSLSSLPAGSSKTLPSPIKPSSKSNAGGGGDQAENKKERNVFFTIGRAAGNKLKIKD